MDQAMLRLLATPKTTATRPSRLKDMHPPEEGKGYQWRGRARQFREQARAGRAAWGVLGSAAGGHVFFLKGGTRRIRRSFGKNSQKSELSSVERLVATSALPIRKDVAGYVF